MPSASPLPYVGVSPRFHTFRREYHARMQRQGPPDRRLPPPQSPPMGRYPSYPHPYDRREMFHRMAHDSPYPPPYGGYEPMHKPRRDKKPKVNSQGRGFKTKQKKISIVYNNLVKRFSQTPYLKEEVERSHETSRVHAKTWDGLNIIERALDKVLADDIIEIEAIGFHISMKNKYQQKGILIYIKVGSAKQVQRLFEIYDSFNGHLKDHAIAVSKEEREKMVAQQSKSVEETEESETDGTPCAEVEKKSTPIVQNSMKQTQVDC